MGINSIGSECGICARASTPTQIISSLVFKFALVFAYSALVVASPLSIRVQPLSVTVLGSFLVLCHVLRHFWQFFALDLVRVPSYALMVFVPLLAL